MVGFTPPAFELLLASRFRSLLHDLGSVAPSEASSTTYS